MPPFDPDQAAGTFSRSQPPRVLSPDRFPLKLYSATSGETRHFMIEHNTVIGFVGLVGADVRLLSICKVFQDSSGMDMVAFNIGDKCAAGTISPATLPLAEFVKNVMVYLEPRADGVTFEHPVGNKVKIGEGEDAKEYHIASIPRLLPVHSHHDIVEGPITDNEVAMSLQRYHPRAAEWLEGVTFEARFPNNTPATATVEVEAMPQDPAPVDYAKSLKIEVNTLLVPVRPNPNDPYSIVQAMATTVRNANVRAYLAEQGLQDTQPNQAEGGDDPSQNGPTTPAGLTTPTDAFREMANAMRSAFQQARGDDESICSAKNTSDWNRAKFFYIIFGMRFGLDTAADGSSIETVHPPSINSDFVEVFTGNSAANQGQSLRCLMEQHTKTSRQSRDWVKRLCEFPHIDTFFTQAIKRCQWKATPLDEEEGQLKRQLSVLMFKRQPVRGPGKKDYESHIAGTHQVENEASIGETTANRTRMSTECFTEGRIDTMDDYLALIANMIALFTLMFEFDWNNAQVQPTIVSFLMDEADLMDATDTRTWYRKFMSTAPWIPTVRMNMLQNLMIKFVSVALNPSHRSKVKNDDDLEPAIFRECQEQYQRNKAAIRDAVGSNQLGQFAERPQNFRERAAQAQPKVQQGNSRGVVKQVGSQLPPALLPRNASKAGSRSRTQAATSTFQLPCPATSAKIMHARTGSVAMGLTAFSSTGTTVTYVKVIRISSHPMRPRPQV